MISCCESVCTRRTLADPSFFFSRTGYPLVCCHRGRAQVPISLLAPRTPALHVLEDALPLVSNSLLAIALVPLKTYLDFNAICMSFLRRVGVFESCVTPDISILVFVSGADASCIECWALSIYGVLL
jgi:hypothetical protein